MTLNFSLSNLIILVVLLICIILLVLKLHVKYTHIIEIAVIPLILYIILMRTKTVTNMETFIIICIGTIVLHLALHIILKHYGIIGYHDVDDVDDVMREDFSNKLDEFKNSDNAKKLKYVNRHKLNKKRKNKKSKKSKEKFENSEIVTIDGIKSDAVDYYNSFNQGIMKKKSKNTGESVDKLYFLKDKLFEIFDL
jgi:hypothetical protein